MDKTSCPDAVQPTRQITRSGIQQSLTQRDRTKEPANRPKPRLTKAQKEHIVQLIRKDLETCKSREGSASTCVSCEKQQYYLKKGSELGEARKKAITSHLKKIVKQAEEVTGLDYVRRMPADLRREMLSAIHSH